MTTTAFKMQRPNSAITMVRPKGLEDWESKVPEHVIERAKKALRNDYRSFAGTANFIGVGLTDEDINTFTSRSCHASMTSPEKKCRVVLATENATTRRTELYKKDDFYRRNYGEFDHELVRPFLKWFLYESPYGFIILNRDDFDSCEKYGFVLAGDAPTTLVQSVCIVSRHFQEVTPTAFSEFNKLIERGIDAFIAYQICFNSTISGLYLAKPLGTALFNAVGAHRVSGSVNPEQMLNYYRGQPQNFLGSTYENAPSIFGSSALFVKNYSEARPIPWSLAKYREHSTDFHNYMLEKEGKLDKSGVYRPPNPFTLRQDKISEHAFTCEQAVTVVADYCQQYVEKELAKQ